jgi:hypothetical protein
MYTSGHNSYAAIINGLGRWAMKKNNRTERNKEGWNPDAPSGEEALAEEERSLDMGESGQFAPGGYYNQQGVNQPRRRPFDDDDDVVPPGRH